ncbi:MAG: SDR family oxidoreductase [Pseudomonadota bacterium]
MEITGAVSFVTGGSGGLGSRICHRLADEGARVAIGYHRGQARAEALQAELRTNGASAITVRLDQTQPHSIEDATSKIVEAFGALDILVNNAAVASGGHAIAQGDLEAFTPEIWDELMAVNLRGPYLLARAAAPHLRASRWGRIVNIGSTLGHGDWYQDRIFAPSKAAVIPLTRFLAASLAPDVTVNCVAPGLMVETALGGGGPKPGVSNEAYDAWQNRAAMKTFTDIDDVAAQVMTFCKSRAITGQSVGVDAGVHFR